MMKLVVVLRWVAGVGVIVAFSMAAATVASEVEAEESSAEATVGDAQPVAPFKDRLATTVPAFAEDARPADWLPYGIMHSPLGEDIAHPGDARRLGTSGDSRYFLVPNRDGRVCLLTTHGEAEELVGFRTCSSMERFEEAGLFIVTGLHNKEEVAGALPGVTHDTKVVVDGLGNNKAMRFDAPRGLVRIPFDSSTIGSEAGEGLVVRAEIPGRGSVEFRVDWAGGPDG